MKFLTLLEKTLLEFLDIQEPLMQLDHIDAEDKRGGERIVPP